MRNIIKVALACIMATITFTAISEGKSKSSEFARPPKGITLDDVFSYLWDQTVVTVSRREQKVSEVPASVTVITADDIKRSGALNLHELLRPVVGLDVAGLTQSGPALSIRGFNTHLVSRTILVLLNGNPVYNEVNMSPMWSTLPVTLHDIERIEIVRGPGSALWGANAYSGVINILTKAPKQYPAFQIAESAGELSTTYTNLSLAHATGPVQYRFQYSHNEMDNTGFNPKDKSLRRNIYTLDLRHSLKDESVTELQRGNGASLSIYEKASTSPPATPKGRELSLLFGYANHLQDIVNPLFNFLENMFFKQFVHVTYNVNANTWVKVRENVTKFDSVRQGVPYKPITAPTPLDEKTISIEAQTTKRLLPFGILTYGSEYKFVKASFLGPERTQGLWSIFAQNDFAVNSSLSLITGARIDTHPQVKTAFSPRISLIYTPVAKHAFRVTGATSYRRPNYIELYARGLMDVPNPPNPPAVMERQGNENVKAERIQSIEAGYTGKLTRRMKLSLTIYRNLLDNFIALGVPSNGKLTYINGNRATQNGAEMELETVFTYSLKGFINYAFNQTKNTKTGEQFEMSPKHKANAVLGWMPYNGFYGNIMFNFVDDTGQTNSRNGIFYRAEPYLNADVNLGYRFRNKLEGLELGVNIQNVFNKKRQEHPAGDVFKRRIVGTMSYAF